MDATTLEQFYEKDFYKNGGAAGGLLPDGISKDIGHFNVFDIAQVMVQQKVKAFMPYNRRMFYKISFISGHNRAEYADKTIEINDHALLFALPRVPYHWVPQGEGQTGFFCIFTPEFLPHGKSGMALEDLPIFTPGAFPVFQLDTTEVEDVKAIYAKMYKELSGDYIYKYDLLRNYLMELIHYGQKLQPATQLYTANTSSARTTSLFIELLERQFPIASSGQQLTLRSPSDYATRLSVHVNHLNKVLKEQTGKTTSALIKGRLLQEAKILLRQTDWNISEVAYVLGFEDVAHFSNFFKKQTSVSPLVYRS
jgi:AraC family transcriptional activator of pobA